ncbi:response regulator transcription factor [Ramlibacter alkalitolerans]|uniref:Response regulator transcription factor n=1 Tax=Ramlibacter alkalitolerans TaxID=2039631 RepID=A0ABS1JL27_9BURK|nr:response regulator transcription factor [Ramlibacter alkalitolerans]MBL0424899.1 response regulator transcription factor [Ramlibacter alkalitolerans]
MSTPPPPPSSTAITIVVADDHDMVRAGLVALISRMAGMRVLAQARDGEELLGVLASWTPDIVLCDISMPRMDGMQSLQQLRARHPSVRVVMLSMHDGAAYVRRALQNGASGYLMKDAAPVELEYALRAVATTGSYFAGAVTQALLASDEEQPAGTLTERQREILTLTAKGRSSKEIGHALGLSANTVNVHRARVMQRLGVHNVAALTRYAMRAGLLATAA